MYQKGIIQQYWEW